MKDRKGDMPDSRSLHRNYLPSYTEVDKRRMRGVQRTPTPTHQKLGKRDIWLAAETKHLFPTRYRERQVMSKWGLCHHQGRKKKGINMLWWWEKDIIYWEAIWQMLLHVYYLNFGDPWVNELPICSMQRQFCPLSTGKSFHHSWLVVRCQQPCWAAGQYLGTERKEGISRAVPSLLQSESIRRGKWRPSWTSLVKNPLD